MTRPPRQLILLCGLPGSGRTTLALRLAPARHGAGRVDTALGIDLFDPPR